MNSDVARFTTNVLPCEQWFLQAGRWRNRCSQGTNVRTCLATNKIARFFFRGRQRYSTRFAAMLPKELNVFCRPFFRTLKLCDIYFLAARELMAPPYTKMLDSDRAKKRQTNRYKYKQCPEKRFRYVTIKRRHSFSTS